eukprot:6277-Amphidinium_carterae.1
MPSERTRKSSLGAVRTCFGHCIEAPNSQIAKVAWFFHMAPDSMRKTQSRWWNRRFWNLQASSEPKFKCPTLLFGGFGPWFKAAPCSVA